MGMMAFAVAEKRENNLVVQLVWVKSSTDTTKTRNIKPKLCIEQAKFSQKTFPKTHNANRFRWGESKEGGDKREAEADDHFNGFQFTSK